MKIQLNPEKTIRKSSIYSLLNENTEQNNKLSLSVEPTDDAVTPDMVRTYFNYRSFINAPLQMHSDIISTATQQSQTHALQIMLSQHPNNNIDIEKQSSTKIYFHPPKFNHQIKPSIHDNNSRNISWTFNGAKKFSKTKYPKTTQELTTPSSKNEPTLNK